MADPDARTVPPAPSTGPLGGAEPDAAASAAAAAAGVTVREVDAPEELLRLCALFARVWQEEADRSDLTPVVLRALAYSGNYVTAAYAGEDMVGGCVGFLGMTGTGPFAADGPGGVPAPQRRWELHSHVAGVSAEARARRVGFALKTHQRAWALRRGLDRISWTFDPLVARNAYVNLTKLAARPRDYIVNFYGEMTDGINAGEESDRLVIEWDLLDPSVVHACAGSPSPVHVDSLLAAGARIALSADNAGGPVLGDVDAPLVLVGVPADVESLRRMDPRRAMDWRRAVREVLGDLLGRGAMVTGFARDGWYVLRRRS